MLPWGQALAPPLLRPITVQRPNNPDNIESDHRGNSLASETNEIGDARLQIAKAITKVRTDIGELRARQAELISVLQQHGSASDHYAASVELETVIKPRISQREAYVVRMEQILDWTYQVEHERNLSGSGPTHLSAALIRERLRLL
ncbi:hypothetical protein A1Q2_06863 [Trichosporon asahii var. asahii CBS 8904]|uniref:Uncharacterized protein n=2 Tax=Trichosporon asahii var. asahii TaxID=189963 RepID=K1VQA5_TRIAC|nr:hypothetical protein A1Q1_00700 [Trichosporon asahii var. asahii CBS 2479]EJT52953.1 hypothetical protein A1Q1_00700 [Trichosporon asahii var. asahii CBS 2479]EKC98892.1 hypothetical protein A1Q2_06863 [Trichosporon asahii var. asahii CBS 8904]